MITVTYDVYDELVKCGFEKYCNIIPGGRCDNVYEANNDFVNALENMPKLHKDLLFAFPPIQSLVKEAYESSPRSANGVKVILSTVSKFYLENLTSKTNVLAEIYTAVMSSHMGALINRDVCELNEHHIVLQFFDGRRFLLTCPFLDLVDNEAGEAD